MKNYKIIVYSKWRFVMIVALFILSLLPMIVLLYKYNLLGYILLGIYSIFVIIFPYFILPRFLAKSILQISVDSETLQFIWIQTFLGSKAKQPLEFGLDMIKSYKYERSSNFSTLKIRLISGKKLNIYRWYLDNDDDFDKFMNYFRNAIKNFNKKKTTLKAIETEKLLFENKNFLLLMSILICIIIIVTIVLLAFKGINNKKGIVSILIILGPLVWVIIQIIKGIQRNDN